MSGRIVIAVYRPKPGQAETVAKLVRSHVPKLQALGLATTRLPIVGRAKDGSFVEIFEWRDTQAIEAAHHHPEVQAIWGAFGTAADFSGFGALAEAQTPFAELTPFT